MQTSILVNNINNNKWKREENLIIKYFIISSLHATKIDKKKDDYSFKELLALMLDWYKFGDDNRFSKRL